MPVVSSLPNSEIVSRYRRQSLPFSGTGFSLQVLLTNRLHLCKHIECHIYER